MVLRTRLEEGIKLVGKKGATSAKDLREGLAKRGMRMGKNRHPKWRDMSKNYIARIRSTHPTQSHWIYLEGETILDPAYGIKLPTDPENDEGHPPGAWPEGTRITSIYEISRHGTN